MILGVSLHDEGLISKRKENPSPAWTCQGNMSLSKLPSIDAHIKLHQIERRLNLKLGHDFMKVESLA
jgi:hypothetical protein